MPPGTVLERAAERPISVVCEDLNICEDFKEPAVGKHAPPRSRPVVVHCRSDDIDQRKAHLMVPDLPWGIEVGRTLFAALECFFWALRLPVEDLRPP